MTIEREFHNKRGPNKLRLLEKLFLNNFGNNLGFTKLLKNLVSNVVGKLEMTKLLFL